jgi:hypothetical protein
MIPGKLLKFLAERANISVAGSRTHDLVPQLHRISGWRLGQDGQTLTCFIPGAYTDGLLEAMEDNGHFVITIEEFPSHETYQFKGKYLRHRDATADDREHVAHLRQRWTRSVRSQFPDMPADVLDDYILEPALALDMRVTEIYLQTPGPGAGSRLVPPAGSS